MFWSRQGGKGYAAFSLPTDEQMGMFVERLFQDWTASPTFEKRSLLPVLQDLRGHILAPYAIVSQQVGF